MVDLEDLKKDSTQPQMAKYAGTFLDSYKFPVMMMIAMPDGRVVHSINANDFLEMKSDFLETGFGDPASVNYAKFLKEGINLAKQSEIEE